MLPDAWLKDLKNHAVFDFSGEQLTHAQRNFAAAASDSYGCQRQTRTMALRDSELIVAVGSAIRILDLNDVKDTWIQTARDLNDAGQGEPDKTWIYGVPYKTLTTSIKFDIVSITLNGNGNLLAVAGLHDVVVVCLPRPGFSRVISADNHATVECKTLPIGFQYYNKDNYGVIKLAWHGLSQTLTHLVILGTDSVLRMFDIAKDVDQPEQGFDLSPSQRNDKSQKSRGISVYDELDDDEEAVSFALGCASERKDGWEQFTVYYALRNGHVYSLCPVLPFNSVVHRSTLEVLACTTDVKINKLLEQENSDGDNDTDSSFAPLFYLFRLQYQWINQMLQSSSSESAASDLVTLRSDQCSIPFALQRQGPFRMEGQDNKQREDQDYQVSDLVFIKTQPVSILCLAFTDGTIENYLLSADIEPQWLMPMDASAKEWQMKLGRYLSSPDVFPRAVLYESIGIRPSSLRAPQHVNLFFNSTEPDIIYAYHSAGVHRISIKNWVDHLTRLDNLYTESDGQEDIQVALESWSLDPEESTVDWVIDTKRFSDNKFEPIVGFVTVADSYLPDCLLAMTQSCGLVAVELNLKDCFLASSKSSKPVTANIGTEDTAFQTLLDPPSYNLANLTNQLQKINVPPELEGKKELVISAETLRFLVSAAVQIHDRVKEITKYSMESQGRILVQKKELQHQATTVQNLYGRIKNFTTTETQDEKIAAITKRHTQLALRVDTMIRQLMKAGQPGLSANEAKCLKQLEDAQKKIQGDKGYGARIKQLKEQVEQLKSNKNTIQRQLSGGQSQITESQLATMKQILEKQEKRLTETRERVESLQKTLQ